MPNLRRLPCGSLFVFFTATLFVACLVLPSSAVAQTELAGVYGRVTDQSGAVIVDAEVEIKNVETNLSVIVKTNQDGLYTIPSLHPGHYLISARKPGFKTVTVTQFDLNVQDNVVRNFSLQVGSIAETVTITADDLHINTTDAAVSTVVDRQFAENLPMNGRSFQTLIQLTPGVVLTANNGFDAGQFSVNGQRGTSNYWMVDGVSANVGISAFPSPGNGLGGTLGSFSAFGGTNSLVSVDALQEFRIQTSTYAPEFGRTPGGQISIVTRSGTNQFHGTLFDYLRNDVLDANDWFANFTSQPKPKERQNDFGGTFSGPILKDRTFFFFSYEGLRLRLPQTALTNVPDLAARQSAVSAMQPFLNAYPLPNGPDNVATGTAKFNSSFSNPGTLNAYSVRIDHKLNDKLGLFARYNYSPSEVDQRGGGGGSPLSTVLAVRVTEQTGTMGATWAISPTAANDVRFNYSSTASSSSYHLDNFGGAVPFSTLPFPNPFTAANSRLAFNIVPLGSVLADGVSGYNQQRQINIVDNISVQKGSHAMKFGVDFRRLSPRFAPNAYFQLPIFLSVPKAGSGNPLFTALISKRNATFSFRNLGIFAQDTWRIAPRVTMTYGLRWDVEFAPTAIDGPSFLAVTGFSLKDLSTLALAPTGTPMFRTSYGNVAPRVGIAYQLSQSQKWQTVLRGGIGLFYDLATSEVGNNIGGYPYGASALVRGNFPLSATAGAPPVIVPPDATNGLTLFATDPHLDLPYALQWNVALEQALGSHQILSASYVAAVGRRLIQTASVSAPNPTFAAAQLVTNAATSSYNALQLQFQRRLSHGLQALASYTWSHSIDTASAGSIGNLANLLNAFNPNVNRGSSDFDIRNALSLGLVYDVPAPKINVLANAVLRGWSTENVFQARSAPPVDIFYDVFTQLSNGTGTNVRPDVVPGRPFDLSGGFPGGKAFNPNAFAAPPVDPTTGFPTRQGNLPRNGLRGFSAYQWDFAVHRDFPIHESVKLQFRAEMFNVLNHPNFGQPNGDLGDPSALNQNFGISNQMLGQSLSGQFGVAGGAFNPLYQIGGPRSVQFALKFFF